MNKEERIIRQRDLVESLGLFYTKEGLQPVSGRILAMLIVMDKEQFTFDEIVEELQISKSSASNALALLEIRDTIEYVTRPGDRKRYFRLKKLDKFTVIEEHRSRLKKMSGFLKEVLELKADKNAPNALFIVDLNNMLCYFLDKFDDLKRDYTATQEKNK